MKPQAFRVQFDGGREETVTVDGRDWLAYELESGENSLDLIAAGGFKSWYVGAAAAMRRQGTWSGSPQEFYDQVEFVIPIRADSDGNGDSGPTTPEVDSGSSA